MKAKLNTMLVGFFSLKDKKRSGVYMNKLFSSNSVTSLKV